MPEICGRICPQDRLCEGNCVIEQSGHGTVTIGVGRALHHGYRLRARLGQAADAGARTGSLGRHHRRRAGGTCRGGAASAAADTKSMSTTATTAWAGCWSMASPTSSSKRRSWRVASRSWKKAASSSTAASRSAATRALTQIRERHDAVLIATGVYRARDIQVPGGGLGNIVAALDYLIASNRKGLGDAVPAFDDGRLNAADKDVVVIGGGDTAMDCVRTAVRQGAKSVTCLYRRDRENMPGSRREVQYAEEEGVRFSWLATPEAFVGDDTVAGVRALRVHLGVPDAAGRQTPEPIEGSSFVTDADLAIKALGFDPEDLPDIVRRAGVEGNPLGHGPDRPPHHDDRDRRGVRGRRYRPRGRRSLSGVSATAATRPRRSMPMWSSATPSPTRRQRRERAREDRMSGHILPEGARSVALWRENAQASRPSTVSTTRRWSTIAAASVWSPR